MLHVQPCSIQGHQVAARWLGKLKHRQWRGTKGRFILFSYPVWLSLLQDFNNCRTQVFIRLIQNGMNQVPKVAFCLPSFSVQAPWAATLMQALTLQVLELFWQSLVPKLCDFLSAVIVPRQWLHLWKSLLLGQITGQGFVQTLTLRCNRYLFHVRVHLYRSKKKKSNFSASYQPRSLFEIKHWKQTLFSQTLQKFVFSQEHLALSLLRSLRIQIAFQNKNINSPNSGESVPCVELEGKRDKDGLEVALAGHHM